MKRVALFIVLLFFTGCSSSFWEEVWKEIEDTFSEPEPTVEPSPVPTSTPEPTAAPTPEPSPVPTPTPQAEFSIERFLWKPKSDGGGAPWQGNLVVLLKLTGALTCKLHFDGQEFDQWDAGASNWADHTIRFKKTGGEFGEPKITFFCDFPFDTVEGYVQVKTKFGSDNTRGGGNARVEW